MYCDDLEFDPDEDQCCENTYIIPKSQSCNEQLKKKADSEKKNRLKTKATCSGLYQKSKDTLDKRFNSRETQETKNRINSVEQLFNKILEADPTGGSYCNWIVKQYKNGQFLLEECDEVRDNIKKFEKMKITLPVKERTIEKYNYSDLKKLVGPNQITLKNEVKGDIIILYDGPLGFLAIPKTKEASSKLGRGAQWCTTSCVTGMFNEYNNKGNLYIWYDNKLKEKFQFHFETGQFADSHDVHISDELMDYFRLKNPVTKILFEEQQKDSLKNPEKAYIFAKTVIRGKWPEAEPYIAKDPNSALDYAIQFSKERFEEAEPYIAKNPKLAFEYAQNVINGRFEEAEPYIAKDPELAFEYAQNVIKGRFEEAEPYIAKNPELALKYANRFKGRWKEAEPYIIKDPKLALKYAQNVIRGRWKEAEPYIAQNPVIAVEYAIDVLHNRFKEAEPEIFNSEYKYIYCREFDCNF